MSLKIEHRLPSVEEFNHLKILAGWPIVSDELTKRGIENSLFGVCVLNAEKKSIAGMGRVVGDGAIYFHISDVIVHPEYQRQGVGKLIMTELMSYVESNSGTNTNIGLMCSKGREAFYHQFGFVDRPSERFGAGMIKIKS